MKNHNIKKTFEVLTQNELLTLKGGDERDYYVVFIDGIPVKIYV
ncbi:hypothetical protein [Marinifilum sp. N1E240]|nr:hypothetical protein [Marinifilum sp. N1E240]